jgi:hypothetical protein
MPYRSDAQRRFFHTDTARKKGISAKTVKEFDSASRGMKLPKKVKKAGELPMSVKQALVEKIAEERTVAGIGYAQHVAVEFIKQASSTELDENDIQKIANSLMVPVALTFIAKLSSHDDGGKAIPPGRFSILRDVALTAGGVAAGGAAGAIAGGLSGAYGGAALTSRLIKPTAGMQARLDRGKRIQFQPGAPGFAFGGLGGLAIGGLGGAISGGVAGHRLAKNLEEKEKKKKHASVGAAIGASLAGKHASEDKTIRVPKSIASLLAIKTSK